MRRGADNRGRRDRIPIALSTSSPECYRMPRLASNASKPWPKFSPPKSVSVTCSNGKSGSGVIKCYHVHVGGRGGAFMQVEMKDIEAGTKTNQRFRTEDKVERAFVDPRDMTFSYQD